MRVEKNIFSPRIYTKSPLDAFRIVIFFTSVAFIIIAVKVSCVVTVVENITSREYFALKCKSLNRKGDTFRFAERRDRGLFGVSRCFFLFSCWEIVVSNSTNTCFLFISSISPAPLAVSELEAWRQRRTTNTIPSKTKKWIAVLLVAV